MSSPAKRRRIIIRLSSQEAPAKAKRSPRAKAALTQNAEPAPHWTVRFLFGIYVLAIIWTSLAYAAEHGFAAAPAAPDAPLLSLSHYSAPEVSARPLDVPAYVQNAARSKGVDPRVAEWIVSHESRHHPDALGDNGQSRGMWQINRVYHPEVSDKCAYDVRCSTDWSLRRIQDGYVSEWSTWKYCRAWFDDCPF